MRFIKSHIIYWRVRAQIVSRCCDLVCEHPSQEGEEIAHLTEGKARLGHRCREIFGFSHRSQVTTESGSPVVISERDGFLCNVHELLPGL